MSSELELNASMMASFTTTYIPTKPGLEGSHGIPLGFIISPMSPLQYDTNDHAKMRTKMTTAARSVSNHLLTEKDMIICTTCLSYLNLYCRFDETNGKWICPICKCENIAPISTFRKNNECGRNIMSSQIVEYHQIAAGYDDYNQSKSMESKVTIVVLDANLPPSEVRAILSHLSSLLNKDQQHQRIGLIIYDSVVNIYQVGIHGVASADVYHIDGNDAVNEKESILEILENRMYLGSWDQAQFCVSAYFGLDTINEERIYNEESYLDNISEHVDTLKYGNGNQSKRNSRSEMLRQKREARLRNYANINENGIDLDNCSPEQSAEWMKQLGTKKKSKRKGRCTGEAVEYAISLALTLDERNSGRILLFTNGCPNIGNGNITQPSVDTVDTEQLEYASMYFDSLGKESAENGVGIDIFFGGNSTSLGIQALLPLISPSGGYILYHSSYEGSKFKSDLEYVLTSTSMSWTKSQDIDSMRLGLASPNWMNVINGCSVDVRMPSYIKAKSFNGQCELCDNDSKQIHLLSNERAVFSLCNSHAANHNLPTNNLPSRKVLLDTRTRLRFGRYDPQSTITMQIEVEQEIATAGDNFVYFQFITRYLNPNDTSDLVTRVVSQRIPTLIQDNDLSYFDSLNESVLSTLLAKEAAYRCLIVNKTVENPEKTFLVHHEDVESLVLQAQMDLDTTVYQISNSYFQYKQSRLRIEQNQHCDSSQSDPPELKNAFKMIHHFRRGAILGQYMQAVDDRFILRNNFLRMPLENSVAMIAAVLWMFRIDKNGNVSKVSVPAETLTLWDDCVIAADNFDCMFIWSGRATLQSRSYDELRVRCKHLLEDRAKGRFPAPSIYALIEGESMARRFSSRLVPSHGDKYEDQLQNFPALKSLSEDELQRLRSKFRFYDPKSDASFLHWFAMVSNQNSKITRQGRSLIE